MTTHQVTTARVKNASSKTFVSIGLVHKYSNVFNNKANWQNVGPGQTTSPAVTIDYNTGFGTTGQDWWYIVATDTNGKVWQTNPSNARWLWDAVDQGIASAGDSLVSAAMAIAGGSGGTLAPEAAAAGATAKLLQALTNTETTQGFKEFLLRSDDVQDGVLITLTDDAINFSAASGAASTPLAPLTK